MNIDDHFFGYDDRVLPPIDEAPWKYIGELALDTDEGCTATLIASNVIVTAAHCIMGDDGPHPQATFTTAARDRSARVTAYLIDRRFDYRLFTLGNTQDGRDWALLRLDQPLGDRVGFAGVTVLAPRGRAARAVMSCGYHLAQEITPRL